MKQLLLIAALIIVSCMALTGHYTTGDQEVREPSRLAPQPLIGSGKPSSPFFQAGVFTSSNITTPFAWKGW